MKSGQKRHPNLKSIFTPEMNTLVDLTRIAKLYIRQAL